MFIVIFDPNAEFACLNARGASLSGFLLARSVLDNLTLFALYCELALFLVNFSYEILNLTN